MELFKANMIEPEEGLSNENGMYQYEIKKIGVHQIRISKSGYEEFVKNINFSEGFIQNN